ncbi:hypothetical protein BDV93DRAFT_606673 [Ceratobasidium sp. AG-I]|nr:hypothetical protein BDV93DRAFT_606673 [Ceratobasidium sp. AG-I]
MRFALTSFVTLGAAALAVAQPSRRAVAFNPPASVIRPIEDAPATPAEPLTNAKRFALNMPPARPKAHRRRPHGVAPRGGSRVASAPRAATSPLPPVSLKCNIRATGTDGTDFGFISPVWNGFGEYGQFQKEQDGALELSGSYSPDSPNQLNFAATNGPSATYPWFGAIDGFASTTDDFGPGSYNYAYLGGTTQSPAGSTPFADGDNSFSAATGIPETIQSAVWSYDSKTQAITAQWINTDGSAPATHIIYANDDNKALALTGDVGAFQDTFGVPYPEVTFTCVPPTSAPEVTPA